MAGWTSFVTCCLTKWGNVCVSQGWCLQSLPDGEGQSLIIQQWYWSIVVRNGNLEPDSLTACKTDRALTTKGVEHANT